MEIELYASDLNQEFSNENDDDNDCVGNGPNPYYDGTDYAVAPAGDEFLFRREIFGGLIYDRSTGKVYKFARQPFNIVKALRLNREVLKTRKQRIAVIQALFPKITKAEIDEFFSKLKKLNITHLVEFKTTKK